MKPESEHDAPARSDHTQVKVTFGCGHEKRVTRRNLRRYGTGKCADCRMAIRRAEWETPEAVSARRKCYRERVAKLGPRPKLSEAQRRAQRRVLGILRTSGELTPEALVVTREVGMSSFGADAYEVTEMLETLGVAVSAVLRFGGAALRVDLLIKPDQWPRMVEVFPSLAQAFADVQKGRPV